MKTKKEIREEIRRKLGVLTPSERAEESGRIHRRLYENAAFRDSRCLLITLSLPEEVDTLPVVRYCLQQGKTVVIPRIKPGGAMELCRLRDPDGDLLIGRLGIREPRPDAMQCIECEELDCIVLPGVAFDRQGNRLGRGGGYFDRLLAKVRPGVPRIALAFACQIVDALPVEAHDRPVDVVLSS